MTDNQDLNATEEQEIITTESSKFDDIRHFRDDEVPSAIQSILSNEQLLNGVISFMFKKYPKFIRSIFKPLLKILLKRKFAKVKTIHDVQIYVAQFMEGIIKDRTDGFFYEGFDKLDPKKGYLFISNHRDISLDPAFVNMALFYSKLDTVKIAIGDNLLRLPVATDLMRLNKSFIVKRSLKSPKEKLSAFSKLSEYIGLSIKENKNVWIAQREGRAKDGNDATEEAILKMFYMYGKKQKLSFKDYIKTLNIVPVSITYEYDPGDEAKAKELYQLQNDGSYTKGDLEDIHSIVDGIIGYKGRVSVKAGAPLVGDYESSEELAKAIDDFIYKNYEIYPSTLLAFGQDKNVSDKEKEFFNERINKIAPELRDLVKSMYAKPYENQKKAFEKK